jgi:hypothetical protein
MELEVICLLDRLCGLAERPLQRVWKYQSSVHAPIGAWHTDLGATFCLPENSFIFFDQAAPFMQTESDESLFLEMLAR